MDSIVADLMDWHYHFEKGEYTLFNILSQLNSLKMVYFAPYSLHQNDLFNNNKECAQFLPTWVLVFNR